MHKLRGVGVALVTPFHTDQSIDFESLERIINYTISSGVDYLVTLGTTGETATLSEAEKLAVLEFTTNVVADRLPIVVGIGGNNTAEVIETISRWPLQRAAAILSVSPYYNKPSQEGIYQHYAAIASSTAKPIILYNVPGRTASNISVETTYRLAANFKNIIGTKEASGNMVQAFHLIKNKPTDFLLISGDDHITLPLMACGFDGVISVVANCFAKEFAQLVHAAEGANFAAAQTLQNKLLVAMDLLFVENNPAGAKAFMAEKGLCKNNLRLPLVPLSKGVHQQVIDYLAQC